MVLSKEGFTLIELLVVVLIIGILASIAVPQYQKAVERSRAAEAIVLLRSARTAVQEYLLVHTAQDLTSFSELTWNPPSWTGHESATTYSTVKDTISNGEWSLQLNVDNVGIGIFMGRLKGKYKGTGFVTNASATTTYCIERVSHGTPYSGTPGEYCEKVMRAQPGSSPSTYRLYTLP